METVKIARVRPLSGSVLAFSSTIVAPDTTRLCSRQLELEMELACVISSRREVGENPRSAHREVGTGSGAPAGRRDL